MKRSAPSLEMLHGVITVKVDLHAPTWASPHTRFHTLALARVCSGPGCLFALLAQARSRAIRVAPLAETGRQVRR
jgi:hypothetical protein